MTLSEYLKTMDKERLEAFANRCGTSIGQLRQVAYGNRRASAGLAVSLDRETGGIIACESQRPDIDWAYLRQKTA
ncbi:helix-turn-helix domain-containing protein [Pseudomonas sp. S75]|uniref:transcriptional regulator n=1 Tax=unclassified Pseudomonas TaxID=196821 RepID=UPI001903897A|nr:MULTISPECIES: YdaS family helix-turn-helix protein [unclassified Pseudomonas]MBJ9975292.1 helix-turn-helix domain-containing protein [Pseudomonas sp. S30]MBK0152734.1 helix-turn-helix domain-containing protein [Pseudomonas sp. S75]